MPDNLNQKVGIRGSIPPLDWSSSIELKKVDEHFTTTVTFPQAGQELEFKFVLFSDDQQPVWEKTFNRTLFLSPETTTQTTENQWNKEQVIDISTLKPIPAVALLEDFELIKTAILEVHPGTYRYNTKVQIADGLDELKKRFSQPLTYQEAYLAISKIMVQIQCDHGRVGLNNQTKIINSIIHYQKDKMPFTFQWIKDDMVVLNNASTSPLLERGTKILNIDNIPALEVRNQLIPYISADGATDNNRIYKMQVEGYDFRYNFFDVYYPLVYPQKDQTIDLTIQRPGSTTPETVSVELLTRDERTAILTKRYPDFPKSRDDMWNFKILSDSVALLTLNSFGLTGWKAMTLDYQNFLADAFQQLNASSIPHLLIDIRKNTGGNDEMANELFGYITKNLNLEREGRTRYIDFPTSLKPYVKTWGGEPSFYKFKPKNNKPTNDGYYVFKENFKARKKKNNKQHYQGKTYLLTSAANTSLAFYTALRFRLQKTGLLIGQETGGNLNDINGGNLAFLTLPNTQVEMDIPVMGGFTLTEQPNQGVTPDVVVAYSVEDIIANRDLEVEKVMEMIKK